MSTDTETNKDSDAELAAKKTLRKVNPVVDLNELEKRVHTAELRAREVEAEVRYLVATQQRREMRANKRDRSKDEGAARPNKQNKRGRKGGKGREDEE